MIDDSELLHFIDDWWRGYVVYEGNEEGRAYVANIFNTISKQHLVDFLRDALIEFGEMPISEELWQAFESAIIVSPSGSPWEPSSLPCFVVSACCPFSLHYDSARDSARHRGMKDLLELLEAPHEEIMGQSPDKAWQESCWAIYGITEGQALALGRLYDQWAVFRFDGQGRTVLAC